MHHPVKIASLLAVLALSTLAPVAAGLGETCASAEEVGPNATLAEDNYHYYRHLAAGPAGYTATPSSPAHLMRIVVYSDESCSVYACDTGGDEGPGVAVTCSVPSGADFKVYVFISHSSGSYTMTFTGQPIVECNDEVDNDGDGQADFGGDPDCTNGTDASESGPCDDGIDNDSDGRVDHPNDPGCTDPYDRSELVACPEAAPGVQFCIATGEVLVDETLRAVDTTTGTKHPVKGYLDAYRFTHPTGSVVVPCVTLFVDGIEINPCQAAQAEFVERRAVLIEREEAEPRVDGAEITSLRICEAELSFMVAGFGAEAIAAFAVC